MKILEKLVSPDEWMHEIRCPSCKSLLGIIVNDLESRHSAYSTSGYFAKCINCRAEIRLSNIPESVQNFVDAKKEKTNFNIFCYGSLFSILSFLVWFFLKFKILIIAK